MTVSESKLREQVAIELGKAAGYSEQAAGFLDLGDDTGAQYSISKAASHFRQVVNLFHELEQQLKMRRIEDAKEEHFNAIRKGERSVRNREVDKPSGYGEDEHLERFVKLAREPQLGDPRP